jgi:hypothetical protein
MGVHARAGADEGAPIGNATAEAAIHATHTTRAIVVVTGASCDLFTLNVVDCRTSRTGRRRWCMQPVGNAYYTKFSVAAEPRVPRTTAVGKHLFLGEKDSQYVVLVGRSIVLYS